MANVRDGDEIPNNGGLPDGEKYATVRDGYVVDGTTIDGHAVKLDTTTLNKLVDATDSNCFGVLLYDPAWLKADGTRCAKGEAPVVGSAARVVVSGLCVGRVTCAADNVMGGFPLVATAGIFTVASITHATGQDMSCATLHDRRAKNAATAVEHIINFRGVHTNTNKTS